MKIYVESLFEGLMVYWDEVKDSARYYVRLFVADYQKREEYDATQRRMVSKTSDPVYKEIKVIECDRNTKYCSFQGLAVIHMGFPGYQTGGIPRGFDYFITVESENKNGEIIETSERTVGYPYFITSGGYIHCKC